MYWRKVQSADPPIQTIIDYIKNGARPSATRVVADNIDRRYMKIWDQLTLTNGVLYRKTRFQNKEVKQLVLPASIHHDVFAALHDDLGHQGRDRSTALFRQRFYWPGMDSFVKENGKACNRSILRKTPPTRSAELVNITSSAPLYLLCVDYLSL